MTEEEDGGALKTGENLQDWLQKNPTPGVKSEEQSPVYKQGESLESWLGRTPGAPDHGLTQSWNLGAPKNPERSARILKAQLQTGYSPDFVDRNLDGIEADSKKYGTDLKKLLAYTPLTGKYLAENPDRVALFLKDIPHFQDIETRFAAKDHPALARRPDEELRKEAEATGADLAPQLFPIQQQSQKAIEKGEMEGPDVPVFPVYKSQEEMQKAIVESEYKRLQGIEEFVSSKDPLNYKDVFKHQLRENPLKPVPFSGGQYELGQNLELYSLAKKYEAGNASPDEIKHLKHEARMRLAIERRGMDWSGSAASAGMGITAFAGETAMTAGIGGPVKKLILGGAEEASAALVRRVLSKVIGTAVTTIPSGITAIPAHAVERMTPKSNLELDEKGNFKLTQTPGESPTKAIFAATLSRYADQLAAELVGMKFAKGGASADSLPLVKQSIAKEGFKEVSKFLGMGELSSAIKSVPFGDARIQDWQVPLVIRALSGDSRAQSELMGQALVGFAMGGTSAALNNLKITSSQAQADHENIVHYRDLIAKTSETVKAMEADKKAPEVVQEGLSRIIPEDKAFTWIKADACLEYCQKKGIDPKEFSTDLTGKADGLDDVKPGSLLKVPTAAFVTKLGKTPDGAFFQDHITDDPMRRSVSDSEAHLEDLDKQMEAERQKAKQEAEQKKAEKPPAPEDAVAQAQAEMGQIDEKLRFAKIQPGTDPEYIKGLEARRAELDTQIAQAAKKDELPGLGEKIAASAEAAGRPKEEAGAIGKLVESVYKMLGMRGKTTPQELMQKYGPEIQKGQATEGPALEQGAPGPKLSALHNLSEENLSFAHEMGGLAVPSMGVVPEGKAITGFGNITLIGRQQHGDPAQVPVFDADAYSPRFPRPEYKKVPTKIAEKMTAELRPFAKKFGDDGSVGGLWDNAVNQPDAQKAISQLLSSEGAAAWFLKSKGEDVEPIKNKVTSKDLRAPFVDTPAFKEFLESGEYKKVDHHDPESWAKYSRMIGEAIDQYSKPEPGASAEAREDAEYTRLAYRDNFLDEAGLAHIGDEHRINESIRRLGTEEVDYKATRELLNEKLSGRQAEFKKWIEAKVLSMFKEPSLTVKGKKVPYNLDNIVEAMSGRVRGQENTMTYSEGAARAAVSKKFDNLEQMRRAAGKSIASESEINVARDNAQYLMEQYRDLVVPFTTHMSHHREGAKDTWEALDSSMRAMAKWAKTGAKDEASMRRALSSEGFKDVSQEAVDKALEAGKAWLKAPVPYFEAKPQRAVGLDEFAGAVIPEDASPETKAILAENKIPFKTYPKDDHVARTRVLDQFRNVLAGQGKDVLFQGGKSVPPFYSRLQQTLEAKMPAAARVDQVRGIVKEVKPEELKWSGLEDFLREKERVRTEKSFQLFEGGQLVSQGDEAAAKRWRAENPDADVRDNPRSSEVPKVSKNELMDFLRANQLEVKEVMKGEPPVIPTELPAGYVVEDKGEGYRAGSRFLVRLREGGPIVSSSNTREMAVQNALERMAKTGNPSKYAQYTLPGGENYRELLLTLPDKPKDQDARIKPHQELLEKVDEELKAIRAKYPAIIDRPPEVQRRVEELSDQWEKAQGWIDKYRKEGRENVFRGGHFDEPNILAHVRFDDRTDADGKKTLFLEEIQSDWHQQGRRKGYRGDVSEEPAAPKPEPTTVDGHDYEWWHNESVRLLDELTKKQEEAGKQFEENLRKAGIDQKTIDVIATTWPAHREAAAQLAPGSVAIYEGSYAALQEQSRRAMDISGRLHEQTQDQLRGQEDAQIKRNALPPDAPFKKTWHEFAMKRMIRYAAENGYDKLGWTTGEQQAERYDLSKQVEGIRAELLTENEGKQYWDLQYRPSKNSDWRPVSEDGVSTEALEDHIGKELAKKVVEGKGQRHHETVSKGGDDFWNIVDHEGVVQGSYGSKEKADRIAAEHNSQEGDSQYFHGLDLKVGGEGMKGFYDKMLPSFAEKFGKKYGAKVGEADLGPEPYKESEEGGVQALQSETKIHSMEITPELRKAALEQGFSLFQPGHGEEEGPLGSYIPNSVTGDKTVINAFETGNATTIPHELGHHFLEVMADLATKPQPALSLEAGHNFTIREDFQKFLDWRGIKDVDAWNGMTLDEKRPHHEAWADAYWKWLSKGEAPSASLRSIFFRFRQWIGEVYEKMKGKGIEIPDEIRGVFERLHATDAEIQAAKERLGRLEPFIEDIPGLSFSPAERDKVAELRALADQAATERLDKEALADINEQQTKEYKENRARVKLEVTKEFNQTKEAKALAYFTEWKKPDGTALDEGTPLFKLSAESVEKEYPGLDLKSIPKGMLDRDFKEDNGIDAQAAAEMLEFNSATDLIDALINTDRETQINNLTDARVTPPAPYETLPEEARKAIHNDAEQKLNIYSMLWLAKNKLPEQQALIRRFTDPVKYLKEARDYAEKKIGKESFQSLDPREYERMERDSRKAARDAALQKNYQEAVTQKDRETLSAALYAAAVEAKERAEKDATFMRKFEDRDVQAELGRAGGDYQDVMADISDRFSFGNESAAKKESRVILANWVAEKQKSGEDGGQPVIVPDWMLRESTRQNWKELPLARLREIRAMSEQILAMARNDNRYLAFQKKVDFGDVRKELTDQLKKLHDSLPPDPTRNARTIGDRIKHVLRSTDATMLKMEQLIKELDGGDINGPFHRYVFFPAADAQTRELDFSKELHAEIKEALGSLPKEDQRKLEERINLPGRRRITRFDILGFGLQAGNSGNWAKFNEGEALRKGGFTPKEIGDFLNTLSKPEKDLIQRLGNIMEKHWPEVAALYKKLTGLEPEKVDVGPQHPAFEGYRGWYAPIIYDARETMQGEAQQYAMIGENSTPGFISATTANGFTKTRTGFVAPMDTDIRNVPVHTDSVVHDLTHREVILGLNRLFNDSEFSATFKDRVGKEYFDQMRSWIKELTNERNSPALANMVVWRQWINARRLNMAIGVTGFKAATLLHHATSIEALIGDVGIGYVAGASKKFMTPFASYRAMAEESGEMRHFYETGDRDLQDVYRMTQGKTDPIAVVQRAAAHAVSFMNATRGMLAYYAGKAKAMDTLPEKFVGAEREQLAIRSGEEAVRLNIGAGAAKDRAAIMSKNNDVMKWFTTFFTPGSIQFNRYHDLTTEFARSKREGNPDYGRLLSRVFWTSIVVAVTQKAVTGHLPDRKKGETWWGWVGKHEALYPLESVPMLRDVAEYGMTGRLPQSSNPITRDLETSARVIKSIHAAGQGRHSAAQAAEDVARAASAMMGIPAEQLFIEGDYIHDLSTGNASADDFWEFWHNVIRYHRKH